jgi:GxxExxY protein
MTGGTTRAGLELLHGSIRDVSSERELALTVRYKSVVVGDSRADLIAEGRVMVECKAVDKIIPAYEMQLLNYLKATGITVGLILNFGPRPSFRRLLLSSSPQEGSAVIRA